MSGPKGEFVEGDEETGGRKRVNEDKDTRSAKRAKVEGEAAGDGTKEGEEELNNKIERLRGLLADDPKKLSRKDVEEVINSLNVDEIISLALKSDQGKGSDDDGEKWTEDEDWCEKAFKTVRSMLCSIGDVYTADIRLVYEKWPPKAFAMVLLSALDSDAFWDFTEPLEMVECYDLIPKLCPVLPWKLFAHVLYQKGLMIFDDEIDEEEISRMQEEAAKRCSFCSGKATHRGIFGSFCTFMDVIPKGTVFPAGYLIECRNCGFWTSQSPFEGCFICDCEVGRAVPK